MEKILSQDEIDALLNGVVSGEVETAPAAETAAEATTGVKGYDLLNQERIIRGRMPTLEMINDRFVRRQAVAWTGVLREAIEFVVVGTQVIKFGEFLKKIPMPSSLNVFHMAPLRGSGLFVMDAFLVYLLVDYFFGGKGQTHVKPEGRDFTAVQLRMIKKLLMLALADLEKAWQAIMPVKVDYVRSESNPQFAMVVTASEVVIVVTLQVIIGETTRDLFVVYPYSMLEPIKEKLYSGLVSDQLEQDGSWNSKFRDLIHECELPIAVKLGSTTVTVQDVLNFAPGDVVMLDQRPGDPLECYVEDYLKFLGSPGVFKGNHACRVTKVLA
ncbi:flagellar motor switch protein FliM [Nitrospira lenta]|uniref:Flagellar motor switch protein FliM n=1 Tax=Nitrospira lenta TaxID=1436998 RepID=A0A330L7H7_9BACT|nr:flagellar motor switch protein FliM [Nitrospira lenta]SPP65201.1 Flagellar motor switch protein FliM [Nitrospira lenta]